MRQHSGCLYFLAGICLCKMPKPKEHPVEEEDEPDMIVTKEDDKKDENEKDEKDEKDENENDKKDGDDEEAPPEKAQ